jgi:hypothetical protein
MADHSGDMSIQSRMRLGDVKDVYYYGQKTLEKQAIPTVQDTRFLQALPSKTQGSSTFIISPDQGLSDVIVAFKLPRPVAEGGTQTYNGLAVPRAWGYKLINRVSVRYGGSSQYFWTGDQIFVENMREMTSPSTRDALVQLGGAECKKPADFQGDALYAYIPLNLPHSSPNGGLEKPNPFPTELLNQPVVITLELNAINSIFITAVPAVPSQSVAPIELEDAWFQTRMVHAHDAGALMRPMGSGAGYSFPLKAFYQNQIDVPLQNTTESQAVTLTGFRAGDVRSIFCWVEDKSLTAAGNPYDFVLPRDIQLLYNGLVYQRYKGTSSMVWDIMASDVPAQFANSIISQSGTGVATTAFTSVAKMSNWLNLPFSQIYEQLSGSHLLVRGKEISNAVVNLELALPYTSASNFVLHVVYAYNALLFESSGSAEYVF